jgi:formate-dependent nitrite reductase membrane component NrfD
MAADPLEPEPQTPVPRGRFQYSLQSLAILMAIIAITSAIYAGLVARGPTWPIYVVLACAAPLLLLSLVTAAGALTRFYERMRRPDEES